MLLALDRKLHIAPIEDMEGGLRNVLDVATGIGNWAIAFGNEACSFDVLVRHITHRFMSSKCLSICKYARHRYQPYAA
jgi:ubiquinone/menaquinone biosynthesis C-methylase UbiE